MTFRPRPRLRVFDIRISALIELYRWRLRAHWVQELLACVGIALGVALLFGALVANTSISASASQLVHAVTGSSQFEVTSRSSAGVSENLADEIGALPGVRVASPILREEAAVAGPHGRRLVQLLGVSASLAFLHTEVGKNLGAGTELLAGGIGLPSGVAAEVGVEGGDKVGVIAGGDRHPSTVRAILSPGLVGAIAESPLAVALLPVAQALSDERRHISLVLVESQPHAQARVRAELARIADGRLDVYPADHELALLRGASAPTDQSTALFAAISAIVGFLLALNALLLTMPERRRFVADLRTQGFRARQVMLILITQALALGLVAALLGLALGAYLSSTLFGPVPSYLTFAFPIGPRHVVQWSSVALALACGLIAAMIASAPPMLDLLPSRPVDAVYGDSGEAGQAMTRRSVARSALLSITLASAVIAVSLAAPRVTVAAGVALAVAAILVVPCVFSGFGTLITPLSDRLRGSMLALAVIEFRGTATRSAALASVAAIAVYGNIAVQGARHDLMRGLDAAVTEYLGTADIWVTTGENVFTTDSFADRGAAARVRRAPDVASVRVYQGGLLDVGSRRLWIRARPASDSAMLQPSQLVQGSFRHASELLRRGGWAAVSDGFASEHHLQVGRRFMLPTPAGSALFRVAAITTNAGWPPGAITIDTQDYTRDWMTSDPAALEVMLVPGASVRQAVRAIRAALVGRPGLWVQSRSDREAQFKANARQGLRSLGQIATLLLLIAALAIAFALSGAIWQRRHRLAALKAQGFDSGQLWRALLLESTIVLGVGCAVGAVFGTIGHALASRWLRLTTGFPAKLSLGIVEVLVTLGIVAGVAVLVISVPGLIAARVPAGASFHD